MADTIEDDNRTFAIYVPPNTSIKDGNTVESCLRLGAAPVLTPDPTKDPASADENKTYNDVVAAVQTLSGLSLETYQRSSGIALLTPGTINLVAANGVNITSDTSTNSTSGSTYTVTQAPSKHVISASYTSHDDGTWGTSNFTNAATVSVYAVPLQANYGIALASYSLQGPLILANNYGLTWNSTIGASITAQLAHLVNIGWHTIVSTKLDGSNSAYFTKDQASTAGEQFKWTVPVAKSFAEYDAKQEKFCMAVTLATAAIDACVIAYSGLFGLFSLGGSPSTVQGWLKCAEPVAIAATALNGILAVLGLVAGFLVDEATDDKSPNNKGATTLTIKDGWFELATDTTEGKADPTSKTLTLARNGAITLSTGKGTSILTLGRNDGITLSTGKGATITLNDASVKIEATEIELCGHVSYTKPIPGPDPIFGAPTTARSIGLSGEGEPGGGSGQGIPVGWPPGQ